MRTRTHIHHNLRIVPIEQCNRSLNACVSVACEYFPHCYYDMICTFELLDLFGPFDTMDGLFVVRCRTHGVQSTNNIIFRLLINCFALPLLRSPPSFLSYAKIIAFVSRGLMRKWCKYAQLNLSSKIPSVCELLQFQVSKALTSVLDSYPKGSNRTTAQ